jgi:hypothetical protein
VDGGSTVLIVFLVGNPLWGESAEGGESWGTFPTCVFTVSVGNDTDRLITGRKVGDFVFKSVSKTIVHAATTGKDDVLAKVISVRFVEIVVINWGPGKGVKGLAGFTIKLGVEEELGALESNGTSNVHDGALSIGHGIGDVLGLS